MNYFTEIQKFEKKFIFKEKSLVNSFDILHTHILHAKLKTEMFSIFHHNLSVPSYKSLKCKPTNFRY